MLEFKRIKALPSPCLEIMWNEVVEVLTADQLLQIPQEMEALFVRNSTESILGVYTLVTDDELGKFMVRAEELYSVLWMNPISFCLPLRLHYRNHLPKAFQPMMAEKSNCGAP